MANAITITLTIESLGQIPEAHEDGSPQGQKTISYFENGLCDEPLDKQLQHFGKARALQMVSEELSSWLSDLGAMPQVHAITLDD